MEQQSPEQQSPEPQNPQPQNLEQQNADLPVTPGPAPAQEPSAETRPKLGDRMRDWLRTAVLWFAGVAALVIVYFVLAAFLPRWWANRVGANVDGSFTRGTTSGLLFGILGTALTLVLLGLAALALYQRRKVIAGILAVLGVVASIPNLLTLSVVVGSSKAAHAGERILDVEAPAFRGATLIGVIIGAVLAAVIGFLIYRYRSRGRRLAQAQAELAGR
ncbi:hypothetical protein GOHSU_04_00070 [Gordonia hirsuta DSM 44140 = NBRC 16056]|uniref:Permease n=1 Tax=Gordonia hirsuta DSM 44140 = NBRC 16056 TaxID=1121927 RepID=L7L7Y7_9ACTN|nr:hypothetical protein [Gordonia hirsuta]GAC56138.1 hypothetical protein GOHSU_04_00070 [Gordonia hirsuta DSM 44140 = NBRC 16056]